MEETNKPANQPTKTTRAKTTASKSAVEKIESLIQDNEESIHLVLDVLEATVQKSKNLTERQKKQALAALNLVELFLPE